MNDLDATNLFPDEAAIHAYVDGRLDSASAARVEAWLGRHPERAREARAWQHDAQQLRAALGKLPTSPSPTRLDPAAVGAHRRERARIRFASAASLVLVLCLGGIGGWEARQLSTARASAPMADAVQAYRMFVIDHDTPLDVTQRHAGELRAWLCRHFQTAAALPNLAASGFTPVGGRLIPTDSGPAAMVVYRNGHGDVVSLYMRSPSPHTGLVTRGLRRDGQLAAAYWSDDGYNYALVSRAGRLDLRAVRAGAQATHDACDQKFGAEDGSAPSGWDKTPVRPGFRER